MGAAGTLSSILVPLQLYVGFAFRLPTLSSIVSHGRGGFRGPEDGKRGARQGGSSDREPVGGGCGGRRGIGRRAVRDGRLSFPAARVRLLHVSDRGLSGEI